MDLTALENELVAARPVFASLSPGWTGLIRHKAAQYVGLGLLSLRAAKQLHKGVPAAEVAGGVLGTMATRKITTVPRRQIVAAHAHVRHIPTRDVLRKNGMGGRGWITRPGRYPMVIVFHDANKAGPHIDIHIGRLSLIRRVKPEVYEQLRYNNEGALTANSRKVLLDFLKSEIDNGSRIPQNLDHSLTNAKASWTGGNRSDQWYGAGTTRQVIASSDVDVYKTGPDRPVEFYAPLLNPHRGMYIHRLYPGSDTRAPILVWGNLKSQPPALHDRLHLKLVQPEDADKLTTRADMATSTAKYDGSSCYVVITPKGTRVYSPRQSVVTGEQIEYTYKLDGLANVTAPHTIVGMGELLFREHKLFGKGAYVPQAVGSGVLNSNDVVPDSLRPEIRLYRIDKMGRQSVSDADFWTNRALQEEVAALSPKHLSVVDLMSPQEAMAQGFEGVVAVPPGASVNDGFKMKYWGDTFDWKIEHVDFQPGDRGGIAGVLRCISLESGKAFNLGPGQTGDRALVEEMMTSPERYEGRVLKVASRHGHEGRASKVVGMHDDK